MREERGYQPNVLSVELINWLIWKIRFKLLCYLWFISSKLLENIVVYRAQNMLI